MLLLGGTMSGREGFERGLATHLVEEESQLDEQVAAIAKRLCAGGPHAMAATKRWLNEFDGSCEDNVLDDAAELSATMIAGEEAQARLRAVWSK